MALPPRRPARWRPRLPRALAGLAAAAAVAALSTACDRRALEARKRIAPEYDPQTGRLTLLKYDSNGNGRVDTWSYMDGARVVRVEIDEDEDGTIDRWEYYTADQKIEKIGRSRAKDGKPDQWIYQRPDGSVERIEISTRRDGRVTRVERYEHDTMVSAEEDSDGDGLVDKWETYDGPRLASVAFDTQHLGRPERRLTYAANGAVTLEVAAPDGAFRSVRTPPSPDPRRGANAGAPPANPR
jgi:hypothetical protein